jgi:diguanylate cyclase (GGDEF)-like protein
MSALPRLRRTLVRFGPSGCAGVAAAALAAGRVRPFAASGWPEIAELGLLLAALGFVGVRRLRRAVEGWVPRLADDVEFGALLLALAESVALLGGGVRSPLYPIVYLVMAFLVAFLRPAAGAILTGIALGLDLTAFVGLGALPAAWPDCAAHAGFLTLFALLYQLVLAAQVAASRRAEGQAVARRVRQIEEWAREYRLIASGSEGVDPSPEGQARWMAAAVKEVEQAVGAALEVAECALRTHSCAVFLLSADDRELRLHDCRSVGEALRREPFPSGEGILGGVVRRRMALRLHGEFKGVSYYEGSVPVQSVLAVPLLDRRGRRSSAEGTGDPGGQVRGVLVADRLSDLPFTDEDERLLQAVGREVLRSIEVERVMGHIKQARDEKDRFYRAMEVLNRTTKPEEVFDTTLELCRSLVPMDFAALTLVEDRPGEPRRHRIVKVAGVHAGQALAGHVFPDNTGLCSNVVRYGTPLPGHGVFLGERPAVFDDEAQLRGLQALKILPLKSGDRMLGTLVAASRRRGAFDDEAVRTLEVLALQAGQSLQRAQLFAEVERMATTDGLTGLTNHRQFQSLLDQRLALAKRYGKPLSFILCDIDHFKTVNDTYGHPAGDLILKGVARILEAQARETDIVARYGGEEFALVLPETDSGAARILAERIRAAIEAASFQTETGTLKITLSLGVATFPDAAEEKQPLIERADQALYAAKRSGRNRWVLAEPRPAAVGAVG